jgi:two-component system cell cycle sensor histidine kinase/response regulator CckA
VPGPTDHELYRLFDRSPIGMYRSTEDGRFLFVNPALAAMLDYPSVEDLLAVNLVRDIYVDPTARPRLIRDYRARGAIDGVRVEWKTRTGRLLTIQLYGHIVEDEHGDASFDASVLDVTAAEAASRELRVQREELERTAHTLDIVVRQMPAMYWLVDHDLRVVSVGGAVRELAGYEPDRWIGHTLYEVRAVDGGSGDSVSSHHRALTGETITFASEYLGKQFSTTVAPHRVDDRIVGAIGTAIDVTALRALEHRMVDAQRAESLGVLAGGLAHDFNNLLVAILGNADLGLRDTRPGVPGHAALDNIRQAALRAAELTDQLLAYAGRGGVAPTRVAPRPLIDELLRISAPAMPDNIEVHVDIPDDLTMRGDASQIRQILLNLIANARDALGEPGGRIAISGSIVHHAGAPGLDDVITPAAGDYVMLQIADNGPGIDRETRRRIFEPFFTTKPTGHGLGLAATLGVVRAHGGGLRLISGPGKGARFEVLWPATPTIGAVPAVVAPATARTVLVIDDEDLVRDVVARMIEDLGYAAVTAPDGPTGLDVVERRQIDIVLVDLTMPRMNGVDVVAALRARRPGLPVVLCTGYDRDRKGPVQADAYLPKPFRIEALEQLLTRLLPAAGRQEV